MTSRSSSRSRTRPSRREPSSIQPYPSAGSVSTSSVLGSLTTALGEVRVVATTLGIAGVEFEESKHPSPVFSNLSEEIDPLHPEWNASREAFERARDHLLSALDQLTAYFAGTRRVFDLPLDLSGTDFERSVWNALTRIPYGETRTYSQIAIAVGRPTATRAAGAANGRNPVAIIVPCHRVIGANGSLVGFGGGLERKRWLLDHESGAGRLSLAR